MKHIVRNRGTRAYLSAGGTWVNDFSLAEDFINAGAAITAVQKHCEHREVELVLVIGQKLSDYDLALALFPGH